MSKKKEFLELIKKNISKYGYHVTLVNGGQHPHYAYTIGLYKKYGFELVIAGGYISTGSYERTFDLILKGLNSGLSLDSIYESESIGETLKLLEVHSSWKKKMILGVYDYYNNNNVKAFQVIPNSERLLDTPNMNKPWNEDDSVWNWLDKEWNENVPKNAYSITNIEFLKGEAITEVMRWEDEYWEMFVGDSTNIPDEDVRILPIGAMIGIDESLKTTINLKNGNGLWRESKESEWQAWE